MFSKSEPEIKKVFKAIAKKSDKRKDQDKVYKKIVKEMMAVSDKCELSTPVCIVKAQGLHHMKKRIGFLTDKRYLKRACNPCQTWCEENPLLAIEKGMSLSKFTK